MTDNFDRDNETDEGTASGDFTWTPVTDGKFSSAAIDLGVLVQNWPTGSDRPEPAEFWDVRGDKVRLCKGTPDNVIEE